MTSRKGLQKESLRHFL